MDSFPIKNLLLGLAGGIAGGVLGGFICQLLYQNFGIYAAAIPGATLGFGFSMLARKRHIAFAIICGLLGLLAGLLTQWLVYSDNETFLSLLQELNLENYSMVTFIFIGLGAVIAFSLGHGIDRSPRSSTMT